MDFLCRTLSTKFQFHTEKYGRWQKKEFFNWFHMPMQWRNWLFLNVGRWKKKSYKSGYTYVTLNHWTNKRSSSCEDYRVKESSQKCLPKTTKLQYFFDWGVKADCWADENPQLDKKNFLNHWLTRSVMWKTAVLSFSIENIWSKKWGKLKRDSASKSELNEMKGSERVQSLNSHKRNAKTGCQL